MKLTVMVFVSVCTISLFAQWSGKHGQYDQLEFQRLVGWKFAKHDVWESINAHTMVRMGMSLGPTTRH